MSVGTFRHEALLYAGQDEFVQATASFIRDGVRAGEPTLVALTEDKIDLLRRELGPDAEAVAFADMVELGRNPGRILPAWHDFVDAHAASGRPLRGIGEPIWAGRTPAELVEAERHEALLNLAFARGRPWWLLCPYDTDALAPAVIEEARRNHPFVTAGGTSSESDRFHAPSAVLDGFGGPLSEPDAATDEISFGSEDLPAVRDFIARHAATAGLDDDRTNDAVLAVNELATNSIRHGGDRGRLRVWHGADGLTCEVADAGRIGNPLVGRRRPEPSDEGGFGLWLVNRIADLVQLRSSEGGTTVRLVFSPRRPTGR